MRTGELRTYLARLHFEIQCALWAILLTGALFFAVLVAPGFPQLSGARPPPKPRNL